MSTRVDPFNLQQQEDLSTPLNLHNSVQEDEDLFFGSGLEDVLSQTVQLNQQSTSQSGQQQQQEQHQSQQKDVQPRTIHSGKSGLYPQHEGSFLEAGAVLIIIVGVAVVAGKLNGRFQFGKKRKNQFFVSSRVIPKKIQQETASSLPPPPTHAPSSAQLLHAAKKPKIQNYKSNENQQQSGSFSGRYTLMVQWMVICGKSCCKKLWLICYGIVKKESLAMMQEWEVVSRVSKNVVSVLFWSLKAVLSEVVFYVWNRGEKVLVIIVTFFAKCLRKDISYDKSLKLANEQSSSSSSSSSCITTSSSNSSNFDINNQDSKYSALHALHDSHALHVSHRLNRRLKCKPKSQSERVQEQRLSNHISKTQTIQEQFQLHEDDNQEVECDLCCGNIEEQGRQRQPQQQQHQQQGQQQSELQTQLSQESDEGIGWVSVQQGGKTSCQRSRCGDVILLADKKRQECMQQDKKAQVQTQPKKLQKTSKVKRVDERKNVNIKQTDKVVFKTKETNDCVSVDDMTTEYSDDFVPQTPPLMSDISELASSHHSEENSRVLNEEYGCLFRSKTPPSEATLEGHKSPQAVLQWMGYMSGPPSVDSTSTGVSTPTPTLTHTPVSTTPSHSSTRSRNPHIKSKKLRKTPYPPPPPPPPHARLTHQLPPTCAHAYPQFVHQLQQPQILQQQYYEQWLVQLPNQEDQQYYQWLYWYQQQLYYQTYWQQWYQVEHQQQLLRWQQLQQQQQQDKQQKRGQRQFRKQQKGSQVCDNGQITQEQKECESNRSQIPESGYVIGSQNAQISWQRKLQSHEIDSSSQAQGEGEQSSGSYVEGVCLDYRSQLFYRAYQQRSESKEESCYHSQFAMIELMSRFQSHGPGKFSTKVTS